MQILDSNTCTIPKSKYEPCSKNPVDLKQIESFVRVAEMGSFTRAAAVLGIAQPLLSRNVRQLEVELRQTFLLRNGRGVTLTEAGRVLLEHGRGILHQVALAREELGSVRGALAGRGGCRLVCRPVYPSSSPCRSCANFVSDCPKRNSL